MRSRPDRNPKILSDAKITKIASLRRVRHGSSTGQNLRNYRCSRVLALSTKLIWSRGIGLESTILFAREGASVLMADVNPVTLESALTKAREFTPKDSNLATFVADVSKEAQVAAMVEEAEKVFGGGIDVIFNNAGIMHPEDDNALNTEERIWDLTHNINVKGVWWGCKYAIKSMKEHGKGGSIINTASMVAKVGSAAPQLACTFSSLVGVDL